MTVIQGLRAQILVIYQLFRPDRYVHVHIYETRNPAYGPCQDNLRLIAESRGIEDETYQRALRYIQTKCREEGIDAALRISTEESKTIQYDALLLCDRKGAGQQIAAQAGTMLIPQEKPQPGSALKFPRLSNHLHTHWA